jgi:transposase
MTTHTHRRTDADRDPLWIGIDVAKDKLDLARSDNDDVTTFGNNDDGIQQLARALKPAKPKLIVVEATGGYERPVLGALLDAGLPVALVNPGRVRHLAKALGILAKTDAIDAKVLVEFARHAQPRLTRKTPQKQAELDALVACRRQLCKTRTEQTNRRAVTSSKHARKAIDAVLKTLNKQIDSLDEQIRKLIDTDDDFNRMDKIIRSVPGAGIVLSATLLASLTELGATDRRQVGALVGVAPFNHDSGRLKGTRAIRGGRADIRATLYMATLAATRCNPVIRSFYQRLKAAGKRSKVALTACMRKLLTLINAMIRDGLHWHQLKIVQKPANNP